MHSSDCHIKMSNSDVESGSDWEGEEEIAEAPCFCLFCSWTSSVGAASVLEHCKANHGFDLVKLIENLSEYSLVVKLLAT